MSPRRLLLCTDLDRTLVPNGREPEHPDARRQFKAFCRLPEVILVYVTGRHRALAQQAVRDYALPEPDFAVTDVGTGIYRVVDGKWSEINLWQEMLAADWHGQKREQIQRYLSPMTELRLQEPSKQGRYKISFYLPLTADRRGLIAKVGERLQQTGVDASLIWSVDEPAGIGLLDLVPRYATKLHGIRFLQQQCVYSEDEMIFAGDSGNDLPVLASAIPAVLVANASEEVRRQAQQLVAQNGLAASLYLATGSGSRLGGNYSAGILQGIRHFAPKFRDQLAGMESAL